MKRMFPIAVFFAALLFLPVLHAQSQPPAGASGQPVGVTGEQPVGVAGADANPDYPMDQAGILIKGDKWMPVANQYPVRTRAAHSIAASLSYGIVPVKIVADYGGAQASTQVAVAQPVLCICHMMSLPGDPVLVRLHPKKGERELDGGRMIVFPIVGNSKMADANKTDLIAVDVTQPDPHVWLIHPQVALEPGEYALMLGTQNLSIFPFGVTAPASAPPSQP